jgi:4-amino-4-deoxy-L-arabinose transferase-like glycosyltransferase
MVKKFKLLVFAFVFFLGVFLRLWKYPFYPFTGHAGEYLYVWSGLSLIEKGVPISWNDLPVYEEKHIYWQGIAPNPAGGGGLGVRLLKPWLDQPPLYSLIVGAMAKLYNLPNFTIISPYVIRIPSLIFSFITMVFVFLLAQKYFGYWVGISSLLIYGTVPTIVFGSRLAAPENMIAMLMIICLWLILNYLKTNEFWQRNLAIFLAGIAGLAKPTGFLLVPFLVFWLWKDKRWREGIVTGIIGSLLFFLPYFAYGFHFDRDLFLKVFFYQAQRPAGWSSLAFLITNPGFSIEVFLDGFLVLGFLALIWLALKKKTRAEEIILFSFIYSLLVVIISGGRHDQLAWYRYPIYPYMAIAIALLIREIFTKPAFFSSAIFIPLALTNADLLENPFWKIKFFIKASFFRFAFATLLTPSICQFFSKKEIWLKLSRLVIALVFIVGIGFNIWVIKSRFNLLCDHTICPLPQKIDLFKPVLFNW